MQVAYTVHEITLADGTRVALRKPDYSISDLGYGPLHPQTQLALSYDGQVLPPRYGFPMKLRMPTKLGYKNPKHIVALFVTDTYPGGYWEDQGYNWFGGS